MAKLSVSIPDELFADVRDLVTDNVSAFVATAIRNELDRRRLGTFLAELEDELGPADADEVAAYTEALTRVAEPAVAPKASSSPESAKRSAS